MQMHVSQCMKLFSTCCWLYPWKKILFEDRETLILKFNLRVYYEPKTYHIPSPQLLARYTSDLYLSKKFADLTIQVGSRTFSVHKLILMIHSNVFQRMFTCGMSEQKNNLVIISDIKEKDCLQLLCYMYTNHVEEDKVTLGLCMAAHKYDLSELQSYCEKILARKIKNSNVRRTSRIAKLLNSGELKRGVKKFRRSIVDNDETAHTAQVNFLRLTAHS